MGLEAGMNEEAMDTLPDRLYAQLIEVGAHYPLRAVWGRKRREGEV